MIVLDPLPPTSIFDKVVPLLPCIKYISFLELSYLSRTDLLIVKIELPVKKMAPPNAAVEVTGGLLEVGLGVPAGVGLGVPGGSDDEPYAPRRRAPFPCAELSRKIVLLHILCEGKWLFERTLQR